VSGVAGGSAAARLNVPGGATLRLVNCPGELVVVMTLRKIQVEVGDWLGALAAAKYGLERADSPAAFVRPGEQRPARANTMWLGSARALDRLGLKRGAEVEAEASALAHEGRHSVTQEQVRQPGYLAVKDTYGKPVLDSDGRPVQRAVVNNFDLTFSAPKSVSVVWSQADAALRAEIEQAMMTAANAALEHITQTRPVVGGDEFARGFAAAAALHVTARTASGEAVPSPQLHVHTNLVGVLDGQGRLRTPNSAALYKHSAMREGGAVARLVLAERLRALGFGIEARTGRGGRYFEIIGVPKALCERMSGRTRDVLAWIAQREATDGGRLRNFERARAARATRSPKTAMSAEQVLDYWEAQALEFDFGPGRIADIRAASLVERDVQELREEMRAGILQRIWEEGPTVSTGAVRSIAFELAPIGLSLEDAGELLAEMQSRGELIAVDGWRVTTHEIRTREEYVRRVAVEAAQRPTPALSPEAVERGRRAAARGLKGHDLDDKQVEAIDTLTSGVGWACLTGQAGTGKGPVLHAVAEAHRAEGWRVVACALDGATTQRLGHQVGAQAVTIEQLLYRAREHPTVVDGRTLIVIDEASKVGLRHWVALATLHKRTGARFLAVGDVQQIGAIESPGMLDVMLKQVLTARLEEIRRHCDPNDRTKKHPWLADYQTKLYGGEAPAAIKVLRDRRAITMHHTREQAIFGIVDKWDQRRRDHRIKARDAILIVHGSNADVDRVNELAQERRIEADELGAEGVRAVDRQYRLYEGDVVMLRDAAYQPERDPDERSRPARVENGTIGVIRDVDARRDRVSVSFDEPGGEERTVIIDLARLREEHAEKKPEDPVASLRLAYAGHPFPMQGATYDYVGSLWGHWSQGKEETYSGDTRARYWLDVHTDRESLGWNGTDSDRYARLGKRLSVARHRLASIEYEETPDVRILDATAEIDSAPDFPLENSNQPALDEAAAAEQAWSADPLWSYRRLFGPARLLAIGERADAFAEDAEHLDPEALRAAREAGQRAFAELDRPGALRVRQLEHEQPLVARRIQREHEIADDLDSEAEQLHGYQARRARSDLRQAAEAHRRAAEQDEEALGRLVGDEFQLREEGRHPEDWIRTHGETFARGIAAERVLAIRRELGAHMGEDAPSLDPEKPELEPPELDL
jgi:conjugative relaxase-like TrwC/TraI family protein